MFYGLNGLQGGAPTVEMQGASSPASMQDAAISGGMAFLMGELEKRDPKLREPLTSVTWPRDIVAKTGGGWVEFTSSYNVSYATTGGNQNGIIGGQTNDIPIMQADIGKDTHKVFTWANNLKIPFIDQQKLQNIGRSIDELLDKGIRLNHDKTLDMNVYTGFPSIGTYGLVNHPDITIALSPMGEEGSRKWADKTPEEILREVNQIMTETWAASEYDTNGMANHILLPPLLFTYLVQTPVAIGGTNGVVSILKYLLENNIGINQGVELSILPCRWCVGTGEGGTDRMVAYVNDEDMVNFDMTVPLQRAMTQPSVEHFAYLTSYVAQFGVVKFHYLTPAKYYDGI